MKVKGIKRGNKIELLEEVDIPDDQEIIIDINDDQLSQFKNLTNQASSETQIGFGEFIQKFRQEHNLEETGIETEELLLGVRDSSSGREVIG